LKKQRVEVPEGRAFSSLSTPLRLVLPCASILACAALACALLCLTPQLLAQEKLSATISADASNFAISPNDRIIFSVPHLKHVKKVMIERDQIITADFEGHEKVVVEPDKFMPVPPPVSYVVKKLDLSPDGRRIAATMMVFTANPPPADEDEDQDSDQKHKPKKNKKVSEEERELSVPSKGTQSIALFDDDGHEIKVAGSNTRFIENASDAAWLADDRSVVYLTGIGPYKIVRLDPSDGKAVTLFEGHTFDAVAWDTPRNQAFAIGRSLSISGRNELVQLDLLHETVREVARVPVYQGQLTVSPSGQAVGYYVDGDTIEILNLANPLSPIHLRTGPGTFQFSSDGSRILFKRGSLGDSGDLIWVGLHDDSWVPILHDLAFHSFALAPDGSAVIVMDPGKGVLKIYR
jgi:hypothetical protein